MKSNRLSFTYNIEKKVIRIIFVIAKVARVFHHVPGKSDCKMHARCWFPHYFAEGLHFSASRYYCMCNNYYYVTCVIS